MGDRAVVLFKRDKRKVYSPGVYLHWDGHCVKEMLETAAPRMREGDPSYAAARFCGTCHEAIEGGLSLGLLPPPKRGETLEEYSHGDSGVFVVNVDTGAVTNVGGDTPPFTVELGRF